MKGTGGNLKARADGLRLTAAEAACSASWVLAVQMLLAELLSCACKRPAPVPGPIHPARATPKLAPPRSRRKPLCNPKPIHKACLCE